MAGGACRRYKKEDFILKPNSKPVTKTSFDARWLGGSFLRPESLAIAAWEKKDSCKCGARREGLRPAHLIACKFGLEVPASGTTMGIVA